MKIKYLFLFVVLASVGFISCGGDDCDSSFNFASELSSESQELSTASLAYAQNPTPENCNAFKDAYSDYLDAAMDLQDCADEVGQGAEFQAALQAAQDGLDDLQC